MRDVFGLSYIILNRTDLQSVDKFGAAILDEDNDEFDEGPQNADAELENVRPISILTSFPGN